MHDVTGSGQKKRSPARRTHNANSRKGNVVDSSRRWAWQSLSVLQLPPVETTSTIEQALSKSTEDSSKPPSRSLVERVNFRVQQLKENKEVEKALTAAEEILRLRRRDAIGRWANSNRNFVQQNRCQTAGPACCRRKKVLEDCHNARSLRQERRAMAVKSRDARQRSMIATRAMANREMRKCKHDRDRAFAELVCRKIFMRTGGVVRAWTTIIANVNRLRFLQGAVERAASQHLLELNSNRISIVTRFLSRMVLKRRRNRAVKVIVGALSAFTNSNAIGRYARRVQWGSRHLQAVVRRRLACVTSHLTLLHRRWDSLYPPVPEPSIVVETTQTLPALAATSPDSPLAATELTPDTVTKASNSGKRPTRKKGGGGQGGLKKGKGRPKSRQSMVAGTRKGDDETSADARLSSLAEPVPKISLTLESSGEACVDAEQRRRPATYVASKAKHDEIISWLQRARSQHCRDIINYERFTIFPCMVELLLQYERVRYHTRLEAIKHVTALRRCGRLSRAWVEDGYFAKMSHVLPPPPRMPRVFTPEEGDEMFDRATTRSKRSASTRAAVAEVLQDDLPTATPEASRSGEKTYGSGTAEASLTEVEAGAAAAAAAAAAGDAALKAVLGKGEAEL